MHKYLRAAGFSNLRNEYDFCEFVKNSFAESSSKKIVNHGGRVFAEVSKEFAEGCGIRVCGEIDKYNDFHIEYYFPYLNGRKEIIAEELLIDERSDKDAFIAAYEDIKLNLTMIFSLLNAADYYKSDYIYREKDSSLPIRLSAFSTEGKILLPVFKSERQMKEAEMKCEKKNALMTAARKGDEAAIEILAIEEMDALNEVMKRSLKEDIYSIVDNNFMPYGLESDVYSIVADIKNCDVMHNSCTGEKIYRMGLVCNDVYMDLCINSNDLMGIPEVGRRFKGIMWLQGYVDFSPK